ncbi:MAG: hypothetical protein KDE51_20875, partial [Anaerolineales bacterium]|nr:hypothetical protein [Anaerolineales bacterium]
HDDGFICRELRPEPNGEMFYPHDPASTGPNVFAWCEWDYFLNTGDDERLGRVFPVLLAYHRWLRTFRTWPDGSYFQSGLASGMDNQPVDEAGNVVQAEYRHMSRLDATAQALLSARRLCDMAAVLNRQADVAPELEEVGVLQQLINTHARHPADGFYYHWHPQNGRSLVKSIGAYWTLLAEAIPEQHLPSFVHWLDDESTFKRPHRVPSLAKDSRFYCEEGGYWRGGVWPPTNYMVLRGLSKVGYDDLAYAIACNHHDNIVQVFKDTNTVWEFYAPEAITQGYQQNGTAAVSDFVGWSGLGPVAVLLEYRFGLRPHVPDQTLVWDIRELDAFGVTHYPFGQDGLLDLHCAARTNQQQKPQITVNSNCQLTLQLRWAGGQQQIDIAPSH